MAEGAEELPYGYDEEFVDPVDEDLQCSICYLALREPILTRCGHRFCRDCLERHMARQESQQQVCNCPVDREELVRLLDVFPDKATGRKILSLVIKCSSAGCEWTGELREKKHHLLTCSFKVVSCTNANCEVKVTISDLEEHVTTSCEWRIMACDHCSEPHPKCLLQDHVDNCRRKPVECPNSCGEIIAQEEITSHIDNECPLTVVPCPYAQMGCSTKIQRKEVESHLQSTVTLHLSFTCTTFKETTENLQQEVNALQKQVQDLSAANSALNAKMKDTTAANSALSTKVDAQKRELASATSALSTKVDAQGEDILRLTNESFPFVWKMTGFSDILRQAKNGNIISINSVPFYTSKKDYKVIVRIDPDGDQTNKNRYMSGYLGIMEGNYDAILPWPLHQKVTFTIIDQQYDPAIRKNMVGCFNTDQATGAFSGRPTSEQNVEFRGIRRLVSHKILNTRRYIVDDTLFLQVNIGPHVSVCRHSDSDSES